MPQYNQINETRNQLATPMVTGGAGMQALNGMVVPAGNNSILRTGKNPNPRFPNARKGWESWKKNFKNVSNDMNLPSALRGALGGAATGAAAGSFFPVVGTAAGAGIGALGGGVAGLFGGPELGNEFKENAFGTPESVEQYSTITPEMEEILQYLQHMGIEGFNNPYEGFEPIEQQAQNGFNQDISSLAHRFTSLGSAGLDSPDFAASVGGAAGDFRTNLAAQRAQWGQQNRQTALQMLELALRPRTENIHRPKSNGLVQEAVLGGIQAAPKLYMAKQKNDLIKALTPKP